MIVDDKREYWVWLKGKKTPLLDELDDGEYLQHWGKWLIFDHPSRLKDLAIKLDEYIEKGDIDSAKYNRQPSPVGKGDCVMCVYCDDRDKERVWDILSKCGVIKKIWKYDRQTYADWEKGGRLQKEWSE